MNSKLLGNKNPRVNNYADLLILTALAGFLLFGFLIYQRYNPQNLSFDIQYNLVQQIENDYKAKPVSINIESQKIALPIIPSEIKNNKWEATTKGVSYLSSSALPGEQGNSILYGHNWPNLLGNITKVKPGEKITINFSDHSSREFLVEYITQVKPTQTEILNNSSDHRITIYTCSGFLDSMRFVVVAKLLV